DRALVVEAVLHPRLWARSIHARRCRHGSRRGGRWALAAGDAVPWPHRVRKVVADRVERTAVVRRGLRWIEAAELPLPFRPEPVHVAVQQEEQRVARRRANARDRSAKAYMRGTVRVAFH